MLAGRPPGRSGVRQIPVAHPLRDVCMNACTKYEGMYEYMYPYVVTRRYEARSTKQPKGACGESLKGVPISM